VHTEGSIAVLCAPEPAAQPGAVPVQQEPAGRGGVTKLVEDFGARTVGGIAAIHDHLLGDPLVPQ